MEYEEYEEYEEPGICPFKMSAREFHLFCIGERCAWWCESGKKCAVPLLAQMFAKSVVRRTLFEK